MSTAAPARRIEDLVSGKSNAHPVDEQPRFVKHLLVMPLTTGEEALIDAEEIISVSAHRTEDEVTVVRQRNDNYTYFVDRPFTTVKRWIALAI